MIAHGQGRDGKRSRAAGQRHGTKRRNTILEGHGSRGRGRRDRRREGHGLAGHRRIGGRNAPRGGCTRTGTTAGLSSANPSAFGQTVALTAPVSSPTGTGLVTLHSGVIAPSSSD